MVRKWKLGATGSALLATALVVVACSSKEGDDDSGGTGGTGASGGTGGSAGTAPAAGGMATATGGTGGGSGGMATASGGMATASGGMASGGMGPTPFMCAAPTAVSCDSIQVWGSFTNGMFGGGLYTYGGLTRDTASTDTFHVTGMVADYAGFGVYFNSCSSVAAYTGVSFVMTGMSASVDKPNAVRFVVQSNEDEAIDTTNMKGACPGMPGVGCNSPRKEGVLPSDMAQAFLFTDLAGGEPVVTLSTNQVLGFQWQIDPDASKAPFAVDLVVDNLTLTGGAAAPVECMAPAAGGMGAGGASSGGAPATGGASSGGAPMGGAGGTAGAATGGAPTGGMGMGGATGGRAAGGNGAGGRAAGGRGGAAGSAGGT